MLSQSRQGLTGIDDSPTETGVLTHPEDVSPIRGVVIAGIDRLVEKTVDISEQSFIILQFCRDPNKVVLKYPLQ